MSGLAWTNHVATAAVSTATAMLTPIAAVKTQHLGEVARTSTAAATMTIDCDFAIAKSIGLVSVLDPSCVGVNVDIRLSNVAIGNSEILNLTRAMDNANVANYGRYQRRHQHFVLAQHYNARYARVIVNCGAGGTQLGGLWIGPVMDLGQLLEDGWTVPIEERGELVRTKNRQPYLNFGTTLNGLAVKLTGLTRSQALTAADSLQAMFMTLGAAKPLIFMPRNTTDSDFNVSALYATLRDKDLGTIECVSDGNSEEFYDVEFSVLETN